LPRKSKAFLRRSAASKKGWRTRRRHEREKQQVKEIRALKRKAKKIGLREEEIGEIVAFASAYE